VNMAKTTYKVGDKVRILDAESISGGSEYWKDGDVVEILGEDSRDLKVQSGIKSSDWYYITKDTETQYIEKVEESDVKMTQFKVGDKVRVISTDAALCGFAIGDEVMITKSKHDGSKTSGRHTFELDGRGFCDAKHIEPVESKPTKKQRLTMLEQKVEAMQAEIDALKAAQKAPKIKVADAVKPTPNEQANANQKRKAIIDEAKAFVEDVTNRMQKHGHGNTLGGHGKITTEARGYILRANFVVNPEKRTVVALVIPFYMDDKDVKSKAVAKCAPDDVFNADIGKAITLGRALGLDVSKFEKAVQPTEFAVGQETKGNLLHFGKVTKISDGKAYTEIGSFWPSHALAQKAAYIIDDSEAQY